jgi:hypothetical protein
VPHTLPPFEADPEQLAAPRLTVGAQTDTVQRETNHRFLHIMLGHDRGDMCVVVLHADGGHLQFVGQRDSQACAVKVGVQIVRHCHHGLARLAQQATCRVLQRAAGVGVPQITMQG